MPEATSRNKITVRVYHAFYGCETGCCGHIVKIDGHDGEFNFSHPSGKDERSWAIDLARKTIAREWPECLKSIDWDTIEIEVSDD
jgi:hypothetical protein